MIDPLELHSSRWIRVENYPRREDFCSKCNDKTVFILFAKAWRCVGTPAGKYYDGCGSALNLSQVSDQKGIS